ESQIAAMERTTGFSDGEMRDALTSLITMTGSYDEAMRRLPAAADLARGKHMELGESAKLLGKFTEESIGSLRKMIPTIAANATAEEAFAEVQKRTGGQGLAYAKTAA